MHQCNKLLKWYYNQNIALPWRHNDDPYRVWISEIMLQQTQVKTVIPYYEKWMIQYPSLNCLSKAKLDDLLLLWQGLGYYKRVTAIFNTVQIIKHKYSLKIPRDFNALLTLPGIGDYTASAILAIAFKEKQIPIDGNIKRIVSRIYQYSNPSPNLKEYKSFSQKLINNSKISDSVQALMDLGRMICKPKLPLCKICPLKAHCLSYQNGNVSLYPQILKRKQVPIYNVVVGLIIKDNKFLISKRLKDGLLGNLWELPGGKIKPEETKDSCLLREVKEEIDIKIKIVKEIGMIKHQYSHFKVNITLFKCNYISGTAKAIESQEIRWIGFNQKKQFAFPTATHKLFKLLDYTI